MADWDARYRRGEYSDEPLPIVVRAASTFAPGRALDVACGAGRHAIYLTERGWQVTAVDASRAAIEVVEAKARERGLRVDAHVADLARGEFVVEPDAYDLICVCCYLQRDLFPAIRAGVRVGGAVAAAIALVDETPGVRPMNPAFLLRPGELRAEFAGWELIHDFEGKRAGGERKRAMAEIIARRVV
jgi:tellurite methyltransferase